MTVTGSRCSNRRQATTAVNKATARKKRSPMASKEKVKRGRKTNAAITADLAKETPQQADNTEEEVMSVDSGSTNAAGNTTDMVISTFVTFLSFQFNIDKATKGSEEMRTKISALFQIL